MTRRVRYRYLPGMLVLLSPSKSQATGALAPRARGRSARRSTRPRALADAKAIVEAIRGLDEDELARRLRIPASLVEQVAGWYAAWQGEGKRPAIAAYTGETYRGLDAGGFTAATIDYAQRHLRILSALYGVLRPLDAVEPYRLDFGCTLRVDGAASLLAFWRTRVTDLIARDVRAAGAAAIVNLASAEFARAVDAEALGVPVITPVFLQDVAGGPKTVTVFTKQARGAMARWIMEERVERPDELAGFGGDGYAMRPELSSEREPVFLR